MHHDYSHFYWGMHWIWWILWILLLVWIFATPWPPYSRRKKEETPMDILKKRFARGDIAREEFQEGKRVLEQSL